MISELSHPSYCCWSYGLMLNISGNAMGRDTGKLFELQFFPCFTGSFTLFAVAMFYLRISLH